jgi:hypothetical protein
MAKVHRVQQGECISSIAQDHGFFPATIWNHDNNAKLRELRDPNVLHPGDEVFIPDREIKTEVGATDKRHTFVRKGVPAKFRIQLCNGMEPRPKVPFSLVVDGTTTIEGETDDEGVLDVFISPKARHGVLTVNGGDQVIHVNFGNLAPVEEDEGVDQRLFNLGLSRSRSPSDKGRRAALRMFQRRFGLEPTGEADDATRAKLVEIHDSRETGTDQ